MGILNFLSSVGDAGVNAAFNATGGSNATPGTLNPQFSANPTVPNVGSTTSYPAYTPNVNVTTNSGFAPWLSGIGSLLGGVSSFVGGLLSHHEQKKANKIAQRQWAENMAFQKDQFYNAITHRVRDANNAGVHPLAALGISAHGSASPTAHVQSATGLGQALQGMSGVVNSYFENAARAKQLELLTSQIQSNQALAMKYKADTAHAMADTSYINKHIANYNVYRVWNSINDSLGSASRLLMPFRAGPVYNKTYYNTNPLFQRVY